MRLGVKCKVESETLIGNAELSTTIDETEYTLIPDQQGLLSKIVIKLKSPDIDKQIAKVTPLPPPSPIHHALVIQLSEKDRNEAITLLQYLESALSFSANVKKIFWEEPEYLFIPETDAERLNVNVFKLAIHNGYPVVKKQLTIDNFKDIIVNRDKYEFLTMPKAFHREGLNEFSSFRYINAFYNFYYVIEDLYGAGKTKNYAVAEEFKKDAKFREIVIWVMDNHIKNHHFENIKRFLAEEHKMYDIDGLIDLIVQVRGNLHHFSSKSSKRKGTPFNQKDFESMAFLLMGLSVMSILYKIIDKNTGAI